MKWKRLLILVLCLLVVQLSANAETIENANVPRISIEKKDSYGVNGEMNVRVISLSSDGRFSTGIESGQLPNGAYENLVQLACSEAFLEVPDAIDTGVMDGHFTHIKLEWEDGTVLRKGGLVAEEYGPDAFRDLYEAIVQAVEAGELDPLEPADTQSKSWQMGNTPGNYANLTAVLDLEGLALLTVHSPVSGTYLVNQDGALTPIDFGAEQYLDGWFYYRKYSADATEPNGIWRCRDGGEDKELLTDCNPALWQVADGFLYVQESIDLPYESYIPEYQLWRMRLPDGEKELYPLGNIDGFALSEEYLFAAYLGQAGFCRINLGGTDFHELPIEPYVFFFQGDWLYYLEYNNEQSAAYRCRADGSQIELLATNAVQALHFHEGWLYYYQKPADQISDTRTQDTILARKNLASGEVQVLDAEARPHQGLAIAGGYVFYSVGEIREGSRIASWYRPWVVPTSGGTPKPVMQGD